MAFESIYYITFCVTLAVDHYLFFSRCFTLTFKRLVSLLLFFFALGIPCTKIQYLLYNRFCAVVFASVSLSFFGFVLVRGVVITGSRPICKTHAPHALPSNTLQLLICFIQPCFVSQPTCNSSP